MAIGITLGDPTGIGPEVVAAALATVEPERCADIIVFGDGEVLARGARTMGVRVADVRCHGVACGAAVPGRPDVVSGAAQVAWLEAAIVAAGSGAIDTLVTAPISKLWAGRAGLGFPGHTELLATRLRAEHVAMTFVGPTLTVALATIHLPLAAVSGALTTPGIVAVGRLLSEALEHQLDRRLPIRLGVLGVNPHAGESGLLGTEEGTIIAPAIAELAALLGDTAIVTGPLVPDAAFRDACAGRYHGLIAMYHDQALIPVKLIDFDRAVNVTLGLPIVRTSPDHGTAYDIAGTGRAQATSTRAALDLAIAMRTARKRAR
jgi:4-hydroxythreonine-4-phosphate dehydrogenase